MDTMWKAVVPNIRGGQWAVGRTEHGYCWGMAADNDLLTRGGAVFATAELAARDMLAEAGKYILWHDGYRLLDLCRDHDVREKIRQADWRPRGGGRGGRRPARARDAARLPFDARARERGIHQEGT